MIKVNNKKFKNAFFEEIKKNQEKEINIITLAKKYDVNLIYVKHFLRDQISQGLLKGELRKDIFHISGEFKIQDIKEKRMDFMKDNLGKFMAPHRYRIKIKEIANNFHIPKQIVKDYLRKLINDDTLKGFLDGDDFIREIL